MAGYDQFAEYYDETEGDRSGTVSLLKKLISRHHPHAKSLLELACGTGAILEPFAERYDAWGLDISLAMLRIAKKKIPLARLIHGDMSVFELHRKFDVVLCVFDSINHLPLFSDWKRVFADTHRHLAADGLFIFDVNTPFKLNWLSAQSHHDIQLQRAIVRMQVQRVGRDLVKWKTEIVRQKVKGRSIRLKDTILEAAFPAARIRRALRPHF